MNASGARPVTRSWPRLPSVPGLADARGVTAVGAAALVVALGLVGGGLDAVTGRGLGPVFAVTFVTGCGLAAALVHREDLMAAVVMPPLLYAVLAVVVGTFEAGGGGLIRAQLLELTTALVLGAPVLLAATGLAAVVAVARGLRPGARGDDDRAVEPAGAGRGYDELRA